ncbi:glycosyltransferase family 2 protein [Tautonia plasticadhaerens]|uniref:Glycosyltransferase EpsH n=1 Tax=Tautonia plasticadhaerens TaxID=2527974 RepID=A0A518HC85_9BACT|nr:glycosyltransferase family 2 protein [Tautonia plasticadhaerens]QDV38459.1 Putative glycosyltransferase EpsH [Tautonia plasticadhaerens]
MEDHPAGPACPGPRGQWSLSVVVPVRDGGDAFRRCLRALRETSGADFELIVVDDGSRDDSAALAEEAGAVVVRHDRPLGPAAARNDGARAASAPVIFFLDADVAVRPDAPARVLSRFAGDPGLGAVFGSYDAEPTAPGLVSRFRNLLHHYTHQAGSFRDEARPAHTFWTGCGAIRRELFLAMGGFDPQLYRRPAIEDIELGYRLTRAGHRIELIRDLQVTHLKRWTFREVIRTDVLRRGVPWTLLMLRSGVAETDLNVSGTQRASVAATGLTGLGVLLSPIEPSALALLVLGPAAVVTLNARFYRFLARRLGLPRATLSVPLHLLYFCCCGVSVAIAVTIWLAQRRARQPIADRQPLRPRPDGPASTAAGPHAGSTPDSRSRHPWSRTEMHP